jgi:hypothetical protein
MISANIEFAFPPNLDLPPGIPAPPIACAFPSNALNIPGSIMPSAGERYFDGVVSLVVVCVWSSPPPPPNNEPRRLPPESINEIISNGVMLTSVPDVVEHPLFHLFHLTI